jgi:hypothetical protein
VSIPVNLLDRAEIGCYPVRRAAKQKPGIRF